MASIFRFRPANGQIFQQLAVRVRNEKNFLSSAEVGRKFFKIMQLGKGGVGAVRGVGGAVDNESAVRLYGLFCRGFGPQHRRPSLTDGLKA
ncbi:hypothetical protein PoB_000427200 [Plakobranchus ocellatus]|uniref:Uncharacterized protein n=1 Tax=Plakobranchus ocellatus TaxID=259542 RepID=A0AAV3Y6N1_9GAST|nr:hypothetical protein PoB_000427200 [Plakobranchus ocellatus]